MTLAFATPAAAAARAPVVTLSAVSKTFANGTTGLAGLDLAVREGEFLSLLGPSGCGKSTALRLIAGLIEPTLGSVSWGAASAARAGEIGFVFQEPTLMPWAKVSANVALPLRLQGVPKGEARARVEEALGLVELAGVADAYPRELSGGMKMRVSIARALVTRPRLLLMDEPFAALDEITRFRLNDDLLRLKEKLGWTVVFVTHSVFESVYLSTRIVVMGPRPGRILREIPVPEAARDEAFRTSHAYLALCADASRALHEAVAKPSTL